MNYPTQPKAKVRRHDVLTTLLVEDLVVGDAVLVEEGERMPADGTIDETNDFSVDESIPTGESVTVNKTAGDLVLREPVRPRVAPG